LAAQVPYQLAKAGKRTRDEREQSRRAEAAALLDENADALETATLSARLSAFLLGASAATVAAGTRIAGARVGTNTGETSFSSGPSSAILRAIGISSSRAAMSTEERRVFDRRRRAAARAGRNGEAAIFAEDPTVESENGAMRDPKAIRVLGIDGVDLVTDLIKWLEYDALKRDFGAPVGLSNRADAFHVLDVDPLDPDNLASFAAEGVPYTPPPGPFDFSFGPWHDVHVGLGPTAALFGILAALSSQIYRDSTLFAGYGQAQAREEVKTRTPRRWLITYGQSMASAALLFGGYESLKKPLSILALNLITGGEESCIGSTDFDACIEAYTGDWVPGMFVRSITGSSGAQTVVEVLESFSQ